MRLNVDVAVCQQRNKRRSSTIRKLIENAFKNHLISNRSILKIFISSRRICEVINNATFNNLVHTFIQTLTIGQNKISVDILHVHCAWAET